MFAPRDLDDDLLSVRAAHAPDALVLDAEREFEALAPPDLDELATRADDLDPVSYPREWVPEGAPDLLSRLAGPDLVVGLPEHGSVTWTRQTTPPAVVVRPRIRGSPSEFVDFLIAEALVEVGLGHPESFLGFFEGRYRELAALVPDSGGAYQLAAALYDAYVGLHAREVFAGWADGRPRLHAAWEDAGERLGPRVDGLAGAVARGEASFPDAAELACSAVKHGRDLPAPFSALSATVYREYGADYALRWARKVLGDDGPSG